MTGAVQGARYHIVDAATGEDCGPVRERRTKSRTSYAQTSQRACAARVALAEKSVAALAVLEWICRQAGTAGGVRVSQAEIARRLARPRQTVVQALRLLEDAGFVASDPAGGRQKTYFVDPEYHWTGYPTVGAMDTALFYKARKSSGASGTPKWREGADPWRLAREERLTIAYVPDKREAEADWMDDV